MRRRDALRSLGAAAMGSLTGCLDGSTDADARMVGLRFEPERVSVAVGGTVTWTNVSGFGHTVTAYEDRLPAGAEFFASGGFDSEAAAVADMAGGLVGDGETYRHTFRTAGTFQYFCIPHEGSGMTGVVRVG